MIMGRLRTAAPCAVQMVIFGTRLSLPIITLNSDEKRSCLTSKIGHNPA